MHDSGRDEDVSSKTKKAKAKEGKANKGTGEPKGGRKGIQRPPYHPKVEAFHNAVQKLIDFTLKGLTHNAERPQISLSQGPWHNRLECIAKPEYAARALALRTGHTREQLTELYQSREMPCWASPKTIDDLLKNLRGLEREEPIDFYKQMCGVTPGTVPTFACVELAKAVMRKTHKYTGLEDIRRGLVLEKICDKSTAVKIDYGDTREERLYQAIATMYGRALSRNPKYSVDYLTLLGMLTPEPILPTESRYYGQLVVMNCTLGVVIDMKGPRKYEVQFEHSPGKNGQGRLGQRVIFSTEEHNPYLSREMAVTENTLSVPKQTGKPRSAQ